MDEGLPPLKEGYRWNLQNTTHYDAFGEFPNHNSHVVLVLEHELPNPKPKRWFRFKWTPTVWVHEGESLHHEKARMTPSILSQMADEADRAHRAYLTRKESVEFTQAALGTYPPKDIKDTQ